MTMFPSYQQYTTAQLLDAFQQGPARLRRAIDGLTEEELRTRARGEGTWSAYEVVIHVTDSEIQGVNRIRKAFAESGADLPGYKQSAWASQMNYQSRSAAAREASLDLLRELRRFVLPVFQNATASDWKERYG